jgi:hypothetical protein
MAEIVERTTISFTKAAGRPVMNNDLGRPSDRMSWIKPSSRPRLKQRSVSRIRNGFDSAPTSPAAKFSLARSAIGMARRHDISAGAPHSAGGSAASPAT